ncbi:DNA replication/repair protein RecF [bacterium (Candidatus Blackallbacteria) CG17_big_fil_post_rev_8_21_14_2_50_48_46]|uniref:DNA replication and repair protein RecF n=1 Tax=bacterium (Candidatus Blackallbacteria) CG17_big_fil_post_rev_8_21_14_2_50_48_46 TaxID=2014261 RepID=A0A2M7GAY3_9BACT|nr:MAG: DNA replication/repair protein RecF [bacterium (Candidatus Blackallbacteria) CG18_big_fil_WC_8_21_14_2_50_49_26]PIW19344.1 MAG: DNA replication/repair protein RecF [bacterium (Candidatus Blackallbacteria) CG17_big_fil_post_rev_8_21_14_2_50_48_46]PIW49052.1 MAG: DNA replication/repair protein RecF [bacterium (Candidatus Blackallbacteria) CG13_big_fil_rev_8_21_14_2_50_49_14]
MWIQALELNHFRNYQKLQLDLDPFRQIALVGLNAQGKSNLLESLFLLAFASSFRTSSLTELIYWGENMARIEGTFGYQNNVPVHLKFYVQRNGKRVAAVNHVGQKRLANYIGYIRLVCFTSKDLLMLTGQPSDRRQFIDLLLIQSYPRYYSLLQNYNRLLKQRNSLLKSLKKSDSRLPNSDLEQSLESWDLQLAETGAQIIQKRVEALKVFSEYMNESHAQMSSQTESVKLGYRSSLGEVAEGSRAEMTEQFCRLLKQKRIADILHGYSSVGPHRDDLYFLLGGRELRHFGSQGQIRTTALALKMAEVKFLTELFHEPPILLLDDVFSELDIQRQQALLEHIQQPGIQTFLTTTHLDGPVQRILGEQAKVFHVSKGEIFE